MKQLQILFITAAVAFTGYCASDDNSSGENTQTTQEAVSEAKDSLTESSLTFNGSDSLSSVTGDITLPDSGENSTTISWSSDNTSVISDSGKVTRPSNGSGDATVTLTATITKDGASATKSFTVTVKEAPAPGTLDTSFDSNGNATLGNIAGGSGSETARDIAIQDDGKILVTGNSDSASVNDDMFLLRYNADGSLDSSFDNDGIVTHNNAAGGSGYDAGRAIAIQSDGKIVVAGQSNNGTNNDMALWRFNTDGSLDTSFASNGYTSHASAAGSSGHDYGFDVAIQSDGKIIVAGHSNNGSNNDMVLWRYNSDGSLDTSFDSDGIVIHDNAAGGSSHDSAQAVVIQSDGKIVAAGYSNRGSNDSDMTLWRFNAGGSLDTGFDSDGYATHHGTAGGSGDEEAADVALQSDGKIVVTGYSRGSSNDDMATWRYNSNGSLDTTFDSDGYFTHHSAAGGGSTDYGYGVVIQSDGKILIIGKSTTTSGPRDMVIWRLTSAGALDTTFDTDGIITHNNAGGGDHNDSGEAIALQSDGRILGAGVTDAGSTDDIAIWRYW